MPPLFPFTLALYASATIGTHRDRELAGRL